MRYQVEIKSIVKNTTITAAEKGEDLLLSSLSIRFQYLDYSSPATLVLSGFKGSSTKETDLNSGDLVFIYENGTRIYLGYAIRIKISKDMAGIMVTLSLDTILSQFKRQRLVNSSNDNVVVQSPISTDIVNVQSAVGRIPFQRILDFMMTGSIYEYLKNHYRFNQDPSNFKINFDAPQLLEGTDNVIYVPSPNSTKAQVLQSLLYAYQIITYQDPAGNLVFTVPSYSNKTDLNVSYGSPFVLAIEKVEQQVAVVNDVVATLIKTGFFPPLQSQSRNVVAQSLPNDKYFSYLNQLRETGYFVQTRLETSPLAQDIAKDSILLNTLELLRRDPSLSSVSSIPANGQTTPSIAPLLSNRVLAEALTSAKQIIVELVRTPDYTDVPIGKIFTAEEEQWIAIEVNLFLSQRGTSVTNTLEIHGTPLSTCTGIWQT